MKHILFASFLFLLPLLALSQITISTEPPVKGEELSVSVPEPVKELVIVYRPNSQVVKTDTVRSETGSTSFLWTPSDAGVVTLTAGEFSRNVSVRFSGVSWSGIITMIIAGTLLFGGAAFAFRILFQDEEEDGTIDLELDHMPDT